MKSSTRGMALLASIGLCLAPLATGCSEVGLTVPDGHMTMMFDVSGMSWGGSCEGLVESQMEGLAGVSDAKANCGTKMVEVAYDPDVFDPGSATSLDGRYKYRVREN